MILSLILITSTNYVFAQESTFSTTHIDDPLVILETNQGEIVIEFFHLDAPNHVENFILLSRKWRIMMEYYFIELFLDL